MPKRRLDEARVLAAVAANDPPASADHLDDDEWHAAQDKWLVKWSGSVLPDGPQRRLKWKDRVKEHARLVASAARAVASPASMPRRKGARKPPEPTPHELMLAGYEEPMQLADMTERASPARPPEDREDLGLPPLAAVSIEPRQHAPAPTPASMMFSLPPAQRTAAERAAAERAAKKACREERERRMCEEGERALWYEAARASTTWRRVHDPSDDEGGPPCPEACEPLFEAGDKVGEEADDPDKDEINRRVAAAKRRQVREADEEDYDLPSVLRAHPGDTSSDVYERWCDYGPELMRGRPCRPYRPPAPQMPPKPPEPQPQEPLEHSAGAFEERRDLPASLQSKLEVSDIMIEQLRYRLSKAHGSVQFSPFSSVHMAAAGGEIHQLHVELQKLLRERVGLDRQDGK